MDRMQDHAMRNWLIALLAAAVLFALAWYFFGGDLLNAPATSVIDQG
ncbi:hypothetical protein [Pararhizobium haloflavum]|nr:hypothetical protein [Pararhizobium haloflavum]